MKNLTSRRIKNLIIAGIIFLIGMVVGLLCSITLGYAVIVTIVSVCFFLMMETVDAMIIEHEEILREEYLEKLHSRVAKMYTIK